MKTLPEKMNMKFGEVETDGAYIMRNVDVHIDSEAAICYLVNGNYTDDYDVAAEILNDFCLAANDDTGYTVSVWLD